MINDSDNVFGGSKVLWVITVGKGRVSHVVFAVGRFHVWILL